MDPLLAFRFACLLLREPERQLMQERHRALVFGNLAGYAAAAPSVLSVPACCSHDSTAGAEGAGRLTEGGDRHWDAGGALTPFDDEDKRRELLERINALPGINLPLGSIGTGPDEMATATAEPRPWLAGRPAAFRLRR